ncbi:hypothetical protein [Roseomonas indoligenes]|uniref:Uncharacterized protein n=1 Tax=Roseomonas indoligenes TaxID=2820811 RepID=A0A940N532_9PROT|nr:hypothetical protein [Pararoseomonas indoligenes]MBP0495305.1 hypothetical protein [Pararoseomonas indoligenes]
MPPVHPDRDALRLAFRLALLDAVPRDGTAAERCAALEAARDRMAAALLLPGPPDGLPDEAMAVRDRAILAVALEGGFEDAWAVVTQFPFC